MLLSLYYFHDPMCSWCWAFRPLWKGIVAGLPPDNVSGQRVLGGLAPDTDQMMPTDMQDKLLGIWQKIQQTVPGTPFNFEFWGKCAPRRSTYVACRAVIAARRQDPRYEETMILAIQKAYYLEARNPANMSTLIELANEIGLDRELFSADIESPAVHEALLNEIGFAHRMDIKGFPSLLLEKKGVFTIIQHEYGDVSAILADQEQSLFDLNRSVVLYDLTNTYFEGQCAQNPKAQFGRSKEKRSDCPLVTLGLVPDGDGFPLGSQVFPGNVSEPATLELMLDGLQGKNPLTAEKPVIIMDAGIASADNIAWLIERGYLYLVVGRERYVKDPRDQENTVLIRETEGGKVTVYREIDAETKETRLYCHSDQKAKKEQAIRNRFLKNYAKVLERIGRLREKNRRVAQDYRIEVITDDEKNNALRIEWKREPKSNQKDQHGGVYCLRTNIPDWSEAQLWTTYTMLTEIEATFRSLKTDLGLRPVFHHIEDRVTGHLFITLLVYHLVHTLRHQLKLQGIHLSRDSIRNIMSTQQRITITLPTDDYKTIHLRTTTQAEARQKQFYAALNINPDPIGKYKAIIDKKKSVVPSEIK